MTQAAPLEILVVRADRIGDVVLSTPVFEVLKRNYPRSRLTVMVREAVAPLVRGLPSVDDVMIYDPEGRHAGLRGLLTLLEELRQRDFRIAVALQSQWKIAAALYGAGIRYRVGPISKPYSILFYNRGVRQRRSQVEMHEADYNLQLLRRLGIRVGTRSVATRVALGPEARHAAESWLKLQGFEPGSAPLIAVHPGMAGSALNWPEGHYVELIRALLREGRRVMVTAGPAEIGLLDKVRSSLGEADSRKVIFFQAGADQTAEFLAGLYSQASVVVAPSTGPLHISVALGKPIVTFYPPVRVQSALRWGPYRPDEERSSVLVPEVYCGQDFECAGKACNYYPCMRTLTVSQALAEVERQLRGSR